MDVDIWPWKLGAIGKNKRPTKTKIDAARKMSDQHKKREETKLSLDIERNMMDVSAMSEWLSRWMLSFDPEKLGEDGKNRLPIKTK